MPAERDQLLELDKNIRNPRKDGKKLGIATHTRRRNRDYGLHGHEVNQRVRVPECDGVSPIHRTCTPMADTYSIK